MPNIYEIIEQNDRAAEFVTGTEGPVDTDTAELVLRSTAVAADRLTPRQFSELGRNTVDSVLDAAAIAKELAPLAEEDKRQLPNETDEHYRYRTEVYSPLHSLLLLVSRKSHDQSPQQSARIKQAVSLGSTAFKNILTDPEVERFVELQNTIGYFGGNTLAAAGRAARLRSQHP